MSRWTGDRSLCVQPDIAAEYVTADNLLNNGKTFVDGFVQRHGELHPITKRQVIL